jgi:hypothetical protein
MRRAGSERKKRGGLLGDMTYRAWAAGKLPAHRPSAGELLLHAQGVALPPPTVIPVRI